MFVQLIYVFNFTIRPKKKTRENFSQYVSFDRPVGPYISARTTYVIIYLTFAGIDRKKNAMIYSIKLTFANINFK